MLSFSCVNFQGVFFFCRKNLIILCMSGYRTFSRGRGGFLGINLCWGGGGIHGLFTEIVQMNVNLINFSCQKWGSSLKIIIIIALFESYTTTCTSRKLWKKIKDMNFIMIITFYFQSKRVILFCIKTHFP